ncbi:hypothetical protein JG688_00012037 [Phytophthora aleatoria]|uniref:Ankyrin repeat protein n=1 Tax=Phytophthora aleatoria TaxID=2496075 RepID=A0A8J5M0G5_9STRA|nr:hypothetical protein JG688_00012037 [Phytophthora aleatoria]
MDGAATKGYLNVLERLHSERSEGCSSAVFTGAAAHCHLFVAEATAAAEHDHALIATFVLRIAAAANGHVAVVEILLQRWIDGDGAIVAAAGNGHVPV